MRLAVCAGLLISVAPCGCDDDSSDTASPTSEPGRATAPTPTTISTAPTGIDACDAYIRAAHGCLAKVDAERSRALRDSISQYRRQAGEASSDAAEGSVSVGCEVALSSLRDEHPCAAE